MYESLDKIRFFRNPPPTLKTMTQAGGKLNKDLSGKLAIECQDKDINFFVMYGQTEATARMTYLPIEYGVSKAGSIGQAIPVGLISLLDENSREIEGCDIPGELARLLSPVEYLTKTSPPILLLHGDEDKTLSIKNSLCMMDVAKEKGADVELLTVKNAGHSFGGQHISPSMEEINEFAARFIISKLTEKKGL